ncbi:MAG TPA: hypothetical protein VFG50_13510 [Rhodothermales bacterium]|nr:hypothetical protein [Rhodothermales bacterium]
MEEEAHSLIQTNGTMDEQTFFDHLRVKTQAAFDQAPVKQLQKGLGRTWSYSICATPIRKNTGVIFGLNWGGGGEEDRDPKTGEVYIYPPQAKMPDGADIGSYPFVQRSAPLLNEFLGVQDISRLNYSNLCFFRTPSIAKLDDKDWEKSAPLFLEYVRYIDAPWLLMLGTSRLSIVSGLGLIENLSKHTAEQNGRTHRSYSGRIDGKPFMCVPHPNAQVPSVARRSLWAHASGANA